MIISIEGPIGVGKSTLLPLLAQAIGHADTVLLEEPDEQDRDSAGGVNPYLADYYSDPHRWALTMQLHLLGMRALQMRRAHREAAKGSLVIMDRSLPGDLAFARLQVQEGTMTRREYSTYTGIVDMLGVAPPDIMINLDAPVAVLQARIGKRAAERNGGRDCETGIPDSYLSGLRDCIHSVLQEAGADGVHVIRQDVQGLSPDSLASLLAGRMNLRQLRYFSGMRWSYDA